MAQLIINTKDQLGQDVRRVFTADGILACFLQHDQQGGIQKAGTISNMRIAYNAPGGTALYKSLAKILLSLCIDPKIIKTLGETPSFATADLQLPKKDNSEQDLEFNQDVSGVFFFINQNQNLRKMQMISFNTITEKELYFLTLSFILWNPESDVLALMNDYTEQCWAALVLHVYSKLAEKDGALSAAVQSAFANYHGQEVYKTTTEIFDRVSSTPQELFPAAKVTMATASQDRMPPVDDDELDVLCEQGKKELNKQLGQVLLLDMFFKGDLIVHCTKEKDYNEIRELLRSMGFIIDKNTMPEHFSGLEEYIYITEKKRVNSEFNERRLTYEKVITASKLLSALKTLKKKARYC